MTRSWWLKGVLCAALVTASLVILAPSVLRYPMLPPFLAKHARRMKPASDVIGGVRLEYEVDRDRALADWLVNRAPGFEQVLRDEAPAPLALVSRTDKGLVVAFGRELADRRRALSLAHDWGFVPVSESLTGMVLEVEPGRVDALIEKKAEQALDRIEGRNDMDPCFFSPSFSREGSHVVVEIPGFSANAVPELKSIIESPR